MNPTSVESVDLRPSRSAFPRLMPGALFILPLALACPALGQFDGASGSSKLAAASSAAAEPEPQSVTPSAGKETFTVQFQDTDVAQALQMLSIQGQKNIITGKNVAGTVSANLYDVTVQEALDVILKANDLRYEEAGNFIYVYTADEWEQMQQARRKRESRRYSLEYLNAKDANEFIAPLLSDTGRVSFVGNVEKGVEPSLSDVGEDSWAWQGMVVVNDYPENLQSISDLLAEIDTPPQQVLVESTIVSTRVNENNAFGVDFAIIGEVSFTDFLNPLASVANLITGNNTPGAKATDDKGFQPANNQAIGGVSSVGQTQGPGGLKIGFISDNVSVFIRALDEVTDTMILARPRVLALNRQRAQILVGEKVGYLSTTTTETTSTQTVQYLDTGIKLIFRPFISRDGSIRMELAPSVSEAVLRQVTDRVGGGIVIPDEKTNQITTNVRVRDGNTIILGGLFQERTTVNRRQVPILGDIPIVNTAFRGQDDTVDRNEIIFLITPTIMKDSVLAKWGAEGEQYADAVQVGAREGLLPFGREYQSTNENQAALDALADGDTEKALYHVENSLRLNSNQPEMIRLRHQLDAKQPDKTFNRDVMRRIMEGRFEKITAQAKEAAEAKKPLAVDPFAKVTATAANGMTTSVEVSACNPPVTATAAALQQLSSEFASPTQVASSTTESDCSELPDAYDDEMALWEAAMAKLTGEAATDNFDELPEAVADANDMASDAEVVTGLMPPGSPEFGAFAMRPGFAAPQAPEDEDGGFTATDAFGFPMPEPVWGPNGQPLLSFRPIFVMPWLKLMYPTGDEGMSERAIAEVPDAPEHTE